MVIYPICSSSKGNCTYISNNNSGLLIDAGNHSDKLVEIGTEGCNKDHSANPTVLHDIIYRVGGAKHRGTVDSCLVVNSNDTLRLIELHEEVEDDYESYAKS